MPHATAATVADINADGRLDIVFSTTINSYVYRGSAKDFSAADRTLLSTHESFGNAVADLDADGHLDIVISNGSKGGFSEINSYIYWGPITSSTTPKKTELPTRAAHGVSVADIDADKQPDIIFSNSGDDKGNHFIKSHVYGQQVKRSYTRICELATDDAHGNWAVDLDGNGYVDIVFFNYSKSSKHAINSYVYWNDNGQCSNFTQQPLPTKGAQAGATSDPGSVHDRSPRQTFTSRVLDSCSPSPTYSSMAWSVTVPKSTSITFQVRSGSSVAALKTAVRLGPKSSSDSYLAANPTGSVSLSKAHNGHRYLQYRANFTHDFKKVMALHEVQISYK